MTSDPGRRILVVVVCGAGPASQAEVLVRLARQDGWNVRVVATPAAATMIDRAAVEAVAGVPVTVDYGERRDGGPRSSAADAIIVAPATYNSINKLAAGINDTYALNVVAEAIGRETPVVVLPFVNTALADRTPFRRAVAALRDEGVRVLLGPGEWEPHAPGTGDQHLAGYPWRGALDAATSMSTKR